MNPFRSLFRNSGQGMQFIQLILLTLFSGAFVIALSQSVFGMDMNNMVLVKKLQFFQTIGVFLFPPVLLAFLWQGNVFSYLTLDKKPRTDLLLIVLMMVLMASPGINLLGDLNKQFHLPASMQGIEEAMKRMENVAEILTKKLLYVDSFGAFVVNLGLIALVPAISEEIFFRGTMQKIFSRNWNYVLAIWISAIIFSAIHFQFYGFIPRMLMGVAFGYLVMWSGNLWYAIIAHFLNNALAVSYYYFSHKGEELPDLETLGNLNDKWFLGVLSIVFTLVLLSVFKKRILDHGPNEA